MPRHYIDTDDGAFFVHDDEGRTYASVEDARVVAQQALVEMAQGRMPDGERRVFTASVRDGTGTVLYVATLTLTGAWQVPPVTE